MTAHIPWQYSTTPQTQEALPKRLLRQHPPKMQINQKTTTRKTRTVLPRAANKMTQAAKEVKPTFLSGYILGGSQLDSGATCTHSNPRATVRQKVKFSGHKTRPEGNVCPWERTSRHQGYPKANSQVKIQTLNSYTDLWPANLKGKDNVKISLLLSTRHHR